MGLFIDAFRNNLESAAAVKTQRARIPDIGMETQTGPPPADIFQQSETNAFSLTIFTDKKRADIIPVQQTDKSLNLTLISENEGFSGRQQFGSDHLRTIFPEVPRNERMRRCVFPEPQRHDFIRIGRNGSANHG